MKRKIKRKFIAFIAALALALSLVGCGSSNGGDDTASSDEEVVIRVGRQPGMATLYLAEDLGYLDEEFKDDNVSFEFSEFQLGPPLVEAFASGDLDFGSLGDLPTYAGLVNGDDYTIIGKGEQDYGKALVVRKDSGITSLEDLKGKKVATPFGSNIQVLAEILFKEAGLTDDDVEYTNLSLADLDTSLLNGDIDAGITSEPHISKILKNGGDDVEVLVTSENYKEYVNPIIAQNQFIKEHPDYTAKFLKALQRTAEWIEDNIDEAAKRASELDGVDEDDYKTLLEGQDLSVYLTDSNIQALRDGAAQSYEYGLITQELNVDDYIDTSYAEKAGIQKSE
jgi:sulfonate transport system substrate-binding protein